MAMFVECEKSNKSREKYTLIMPTVSIGNVGQLAVDLLISSLNCKKIGYFYDQSILPLVGNNPYTAVEENCRLVTGIDVYENENNKLVIIQQRVPIISNKRKLFRQKLIEWIKTQNFENVVLLSSIAAHERLDCQLTGTQFRVLSTPKMNEKGNLDMLNWKNLELRYPFPTPSSIHESEFQGGKEIHIPGGGMTKKIYEDCCKENIPLAVLLVFCSEGDNIPDALNLSSHLNQWLNLIQVSDNVHPHSVWTIPPSWKLMFGNVAPTTMF